MQYLGKSFKIQPRASVELKRERYKRGQLISQQCYVSVWIVVCLVMCCRSAKVLVPAVP